MNKKVLTLCAGFLLAGSLNAFAEKFPVGDKVTKLEGDWYFLVNERDGVDTPLIYGHEWADEDAKTITELVGRSTWDGYDLKDVDKYLWKVERVILSSAGAPATDYGYKLTNKKTQQVLVFTSNGTVDTNYADNGTSLDNADQSVFFDAMKPYEDRTHAAMFDSQQYPTKGVSGSYIKMALYYDDNEATTNRRLDRWNATNTSDFYFCKYDETIEDDSKLNELYNSTGFNLALNGDFDDVDNIFENQRIKAIHLDAEVESNENRDFAFPEGTYFVTETPAGAYDGTYEYLQNCTFIVVSPSTNDINDADKRKAGEGFQLTTVSGRALQMYTGDTDERMSQGEDVSVYNACFKVMRNADGRFDLSLPVLRFNETATATSQSTKENIHLGVTKKVGYEDEYLSTSGATATYAFVFKEVASVKATTLLNEKAKAVYTFQFVSEDEAVDGKYLYSNAYSGDDALYAKGAAFVNTDLPETQWVITDVDVEGESYNIKFVNRADKSVTFTAKLYAEEGDDTYSLALVENQQGYQVSVLSVNKEGDIVKDEETSSYPLHEAWVKLEQVTPDKYAGTWNVADETEVTMLFARDNTPTSNKLYVSNLDEDGDPTPNELVVTNNLSEALQFQLVKSKDSTVITNPCAYKEGDVIKFTSVTDTIAYYTYKLEAYYDGVSLDKFLAYGSGEYVLADNGANFIIKENVDGSFSLIESTYSNKLALVVEDWNKENATIKDFADGEHGIVQGNMTELMKANDIKTYLNLEAPEVSLDTDKSYVQIKSEVGETYLAKNDENDAIMAAVAETPMTLRVFATDTKKEVPSFYIATDWNENGERMFLFNPADSVDYYVAEGEFNKKYQWDEETDKVIFKQAYLDENLANLDTLVTEIKGEKATIAQEADNNKKVQAGLDKFKFQIVLAENDDNLYWIRQNGKYLRSLNGKLTLSESRTEALKVEIADTDMPTANESINAADEAVKVVATNGAVIVKGAEGKNVVVSTILGKVVANEVLNSDNETIAAPAGIVVVSVDGESFKVAVK